MDDYDLTERIERAHKKAAVELMHYMERENTTDPNMKLARQHYCEAMRKEIFRNATGERIYDDSVISHITHELLSEYQSPDLDKRVDEVILEYRRKSTTRKIIYRTVMAILSSKFSKEEIDYYLIEVISEKEIAIMWRTQQWNTYTCMDLETLIKRVEEEDSIMRMLY